MDSIQFTVLDHSFTALRANHEVSLVLRSYFEAFFLELVVFHQLIGSTIFRVSFVKNILANFIKRLLNIKIQIKKLLHNLPVNLILLVVDLLFC